eukprot:s1754_g4.t1
MPDATMDPAVEVAVKRVMEHADFASKFKHPIKFNGTDFVEQRLTSEEQLAEVTKSALRQMHVFLERYGSMLPFEDLRALASCPAAETAEATRKTGLDQSLAVHVATWSCWAGRGTAFITLNLASDYFWSRGNDEAEDVTKSGGSAIVGAAEIYMGSYTLESRARDESSW